MRRNGTVARLRAGCREPAAKMCDRTPDSETSGFPGQSPYAAVPNFHVAAGVVASPCFELRVPQSTQDMGPSWRADILTIPASSAIFVIWYPGRPRTASDAIKTGPLKLVINQRSGYFAPINDLEPSPTVANPLYGLALRLVGAHFPSAPQPD